MIDSKEISVVIQGPVHGTEHDPPSMQWTKLAADSIRYYLPKAEIVLYMARSRPKVYYI